MAVLNDEQVMLRDMAREWADNESPVAAFRTLRDGGAAGSPAWQTMAQMGWAGILVPEDHGGSAFGYLSLGLVVEQLGRNLVASPLSATALASDAIARGTSEEAQRDWLPRLAAGEANATLAIDEDARHDRRFAASVTDGALTGVKPFVAEGAAADAFVVAAADGLYLVATGAGVTVSPRVMADSRDHAELRFDRAPAVRIGDAAAVGAAADRAAIVAAAEMLGMADSAFHQTLDYLKQRVQFGQVLATFQALQHRMAKMLVEIELMRSAVEGALEAVDAGRSDVDQAASLAKAIAGDTLKLVTREMVQLFGGVGMTDEYDAGLYMKRAAVLEGAWGNAAWHRDRFAQLNGY